MLLVDQGDRLKIVLVRQFRPGLGRIILGIPGGSTEPGESTMLEAARRELLERRATRGQIGS